MVKHLPRKHEFLLQWLSCRHSEKYFYTLHVLLSIASFIISGVFSNVLGGRFKAQEKEGEEYLVLTTSKGCVQYL